MLFHPALGLTQRFVEKLVLTGFPEPAVFTLLRTLRRFKEKKINRREIKIVVFAEHVFSVLCAAAKFMLETDAGFQWIFNLTLTQALNLRLHSLQDSPISRIDAELLANLTVGSACERWSNRHFLLIQREQGPDQLRRRTLTALITQRADVPKELCEDVIYTLLALTIKRRFQPNQAASFVLGRLP